MMWTRFLRPACAAVAALFVAAAAGAQTTGAEARVPDDLGAQIDRAIHDALDPRLAAALADVIRDAAGATRDAAALDAHELARTITEALHDADHAGLSGLHALGQSSYRAQKVDHQTKTLQLGANGQLRIENVSGEITVVAGTGTQTTIEITRTSKGRTDADAAAGLEHVQVSVDERAGRAIVRSDYPNVSRAPYSVDVDYRVTAPAGTEIDAHTVSGDVHVTGIHGDVTVNAISGDVTIADAGGAVDVHAVSGDLSISGVKTDRDITAGTTSGKVSVRSARARRLTLDSTSDDLTAVDVQCDSAAMHTIAGSIVLEGALTPRGRYDLQTHSGDVRVTTDGRTGFEFDGRTFSGNIRTDLTLQVSGTMPRGIRRTLHGTFGDGSASLTVTTFSGDIVLGKK